MSPIPKMESSFLGLVWGNEMVTFGCGRYALGETVGFDSFYRAMTLRPPSKYIHIYVYLHRIIAQVCTNSSISRSADPHQLIKILESWPTADPSQPHICAMVMAVTVAERGLRGGKQP